MCSEGAVVLVLVETVAMAWSIPRDTVQKSALFASDQHCYQHLGIDYREPGRATNRAITSVWGKASPDAAEQIGQTLAVRT